MPFILAPTANIPSVVPGISFRVSLSYNHNSEVLYRLYFRPVTVTPSDKVKGFFLFITMFELWDMLKNAVATEIFSIISTPAEVDTVRHPL